MATSVLGHAHAESPAHVQAADVRVRIEDLPRTAEDLVEHVERVALVAAAHVKMQRVDAHTG